MDYETLLLMAAMKEFCDLGCQSKSAGKWISRPGEGIVIKVHSKLIYLTLLQFIT